MPVYVKWGSWGGWFYDPEQFSYPVFGVKEWNASQFLLSMKMSSSVYTQHLRESVESMWVLWNAGDYPAVMSQLINNMKYINDYIVSIMHAAASNEYQLLEFELTPDDVFGAWLAYANYGPQG